MSVSREQEAWPATKPCEGKRIERFVLAIEYEVWEEAGISRQELQEALFDALPLIVPDAKGDEGADLQQVEAWPGAPASDGLVEALELIGDEGCLIRTSARTCRERAERDHWCVACIANQALADFKALTEGGE